MVLFASEVWSFLSTVGALIRDIALKLGGPGLFLVALADSSFLSVPEGNDLLIVVLSTGTRWSEMTYYVLMTVAGSVVGCSLLYLVGRRGSEFIQRRFSASKILEVGELYRKKGLWAIWVPCMLPPPTPFKIFVLSAGIFRIPYPRFVLAILLGRSIRYFAWGILALLYGEQAKSFLEHNLHTFGVVLFLVFACGAAILVLRHQRRSRRSAAELT